MADLMQIDKVSDDPRIQNNNQIAEESFQEIIQDIRMNYLNNASLSISDLEAACVVIKSYFHTNYNRVKLAKLLLESAGEHDLGAGLIQVLGDVE